MELFVCLIIKKVEIVNKTFFKLFYTALIIKIFEAKCILLSAILFYN